MLAPPPLEGRLAWSTVGDCLPLTEQTLRWDASRTSRLFTCAWAVCATAQMHSVGNASQARVQVVRSAHRLSSRRCTGTQAGHICYPHAHGQSVRLHRCTVSVRRSAARAGGSVHAEHPLRREGLPAGGGGRGGHLCHGRAHRRHGHLHRSASPPVWPHSLPTRRSLRPVLLSSSTFKKRLPPCFSPTAISRGMFPHVFVAHVYQAAGVSFWNVFLSGMPYGCMCIWTGGTPVTACVHTCCSHTVYKSPARLGIFEWGRSAAVHEDACSALHLLHA